MFPTNLICRTFGAKISVDYSERLIVSNDLITILLACCFILFAVAKFFYPRRFEEFLMLFFSDKYFLVHGKNDDIQHPFNILFFIPQIIGVSIFVFLVFKVFAPIEVAQNKWLLVQIATAYAVFVLIKYLLEKIIANILSIDSIVNQYLYQKLSYRNFLAIILFIVNIIFLYVWPPTPLALGILSGFIIIFNIIVLLYRYKTSGSLIISNFLYFILYLCALEISPYIILYKALN